MYIQFNDTEKEYSLRNLTYIHASNGEIANEIDIQLNKTDETVLTELKSLVGLRIHKISTTGDSGTEIYSIEDTFKIDSLQDNISEDGRRNINLRLIHV